MEGIEGTPERREWLDSLISDRRRALRIKWTEVARRAGMSVQNLLRIRKGQVRITWDAADGIDDAMQWPRGSVEAAVLEGRRPIPLQSPSSSHELDLRDDTERYIWSMDALDEDLRWKYIRTWRKQKHGNGEEQSRQIG